MAIHSKGGQGRTALREFIGAYTLVEAKADLWPMVDPKDFRNGEQNCPHNCAIGRSVARLTDQPTRDIFIWGTVAYIRNHRLRKVFRYLLPAKTRMVVVKNDAGHGRDIARSTYGTLVRIAAPSPRQTLEYDRAEKLERLKRLHAQGKKAHTPGGESGKRRRGNFRPVNRWNVAHGIV